MFGVGIEKEKPRLEGKDPVVIRFLTPSNDYSRSSAACTCYSLEVRDSLLEQGPQLLEVLQGVEHWDAMG